MRVSLAVAVAAAFAGHAAAFGAHEMSAIQSFQASADTIGFKAASNTTATDPNARLPPSEDPWYNAPAGFRRAKSGTILKARVAPGNWSSRVANLSDAYQLLYATKDSEYNPTWAVTTLLVPSKPAASSILLAYGLPYDSVNVDASPSYSFYSGPDSGATEALGYGWYVSIADYETKKASFTSGPVSGMATLDGVRASLNSGFGLDVDTAQVGVWGYSGGALASEWALEFAPRYARNLNITAAALGGLTPNVTDVLFTIEGTIFAGLNFAGIYGIATQHQEAMDLLMRELKQTGPYNATGFLKIKDYTLVQSIAGFGGQRISDYFVNGNDSVKDPIFIKYANSDGQMGYHGVPTAPIFIYQAIGDQISPIRNTDQLVARYCAVGASIILHRNTNGDHVSEQIFGQQGALDYLDGIFSGRAKAAFGCTITNVTVPAASNSTAS